MIIPDGGVNSLKVVGGGWHTGIRGGEEKGGTTPEGWEESTGTAEDQICVPLV